MATTQLNLASGLLSVAALSLGLVAGCAPAGSSEHESDLEGESDGAQDQRAIIGGQTATGFPEGVLIDMAENGQLTSILSLIHI